MHLAQVRQVEKLELPLPITESQTVVVGDSLFAVWPGATQGGPIGKVIILAMSLASATNAPKKERRRAKIS
jgi:hypothetical protein